jgi:uncharacterized membrane protein YcaP (DUF421 family)
MSWFESWEELGRVALSAVALYAFIVAAVRVVGKRTTSQMNNFDWIVTVAIGSILGSGVLLRDVVVAEVVVAVGVLLGAQYLVTKGSVRWPSVSRVVRARPRLLLYDGELRDEALAVERVTPSEVEAAVRGSGFSDLSDVKAVVLEADATLSVIGHGTARTGLLAGVHGAPPDSQPAGTP